MELSGYGLGSWPKDQVRKLFTDIWPEMFQLAAYEKLKVETTAADLKDIASLWELDVTDGRRVVVV